MRGLVGVLGGIAFDDRTGRFIVTDRASGLISTHMSPSPIVVLSMNCRYAVTLTGDASSKRPLIEPFPLSEQDSRRLKGPCDVTVATDGSIFFSDTGADGTHGIQNPRGSICRIAPAGDRSHAAYPTVFLAVRGSVAAASPRARALLHAVVCLGTERGFSRNTARGVDTARDNIPAGRECYRRQFRRVGLGQHPRPRLAQSAGLDQVANV